MQVTYCEVWSDANRAPTEILSEADARKLDDLGAPYVVVLGNPNRPEAVLEVHWKNDYLSVSFVDDQGRKHTQYSFRKARYDGTPWLFLFVVTAWTYSPQAANEADADIVHSVFYQEDGKVREELDDLSKDGIEITEYEDVPVDANWEPFPPFGQWQAVARYDRDSEA